MVAQPTAEVEICYCFSYKQQCRYETLQFATQNCEHQNIIIYYYICFQCRISDILSSEVQLRRLFSEALATVAVINVLTGNLVLSKEAKEIIGCIKHCCV